MLGIYICSYNISKNECNKCNYHTKFPYLRKTKWSKKRKMIRFGHREIQKYGRKNAKQPLTTHFLHHSPHYTRKFRDCPLSFPNYPVKFWKVWVKSVKLSEQKFMIGSKALQIVRDLAELSSGKMKAGNPDYCQGYNDGMVTLARELLLIADPQPDERKNFWRRHYILWSDEKFPTISCLTQKSVVPKPVFERIITSSKEVVKEVDGDVYFCSPFHSACS